VAQFFILCGWVARQVGEDFPAEYWERLRALLRFLAAMLEGGGGLPMVGDADDGYVLALDDEPREARSWLSAGAALLRDDSLKTAANARFSQTAAWLLGGAGREVFEGLPAAGAGEALRSRSFEEAGYSLLQNGERESADRISVLIDHGELGLGPIAAHGHADALSVTLRAFGVDVLVDPGTYDYFSYAGWRDYFRSTRAHNTVEIDGQDQSVMQGPFLWAQRAQARRVWWAATPTGGRVVAEHDGYRRLTDPVTHSRTVELHGLDLTITDEFDGQAAHRYAFRLHFAEDCEVFSAGVLLDVVLGNGGRLTVEMDPQLEVSTYTGSDNPQSGWVSRGYHHKSPSPSVVGRCEATGPLTLVTRIRVQAPADRIIEHGASAGLRRPQPVGGQAGI
jgi:hypothetical protein